MIMSSFDQELTLWSGARPARQQGLDVEQHGFIPRAPGGSTSEPECRENGGGSKQTKEAMAGAAGRRSSSGHGRTAQVAFR
jgi:hypothetical protein